MRKPDTAKLRKRSNAGSFGLRLFVVISALTLAALIAAAAIAYQILRDGDEQAVALQRRLLQSAISQVADNPADPAAAATVAQTTHLPGLSFEGDPFADGREQQAVLDNKGRIAGFFTWDAPQTHRLFDPVIMILGGSFAALLLFSGIALWQLRRTKRKLAEATAQAERASEADKLTGLPNHHPQDPAGGPRHAADRRRAP